MYLALPWQVVLLVPAAVQRDQKVCARVSIGGRRSSPRGWPLCSSSVSSVVEVLQPMGGRALSARTLVAETDGILQRFCNSHGGCGRGFATMAGGRCICCTEVNVVGGRLRAP